MQDILVNFLCIRFRFSGWGSRGPEQTEKLVSWCHNMYASKETYIQNMKNLEAAHMHEPLAFEIFLRESVGSTAPRHRAPQPPNWRRQGYLGPQQVEKQRVVEMQSHWTRVFARRSIMKTNWQGSTVLVARCLGWKEPVKRTKLSNSTGLIR